MHSAVLADFSRCLHVRKRTHSPPSDLGNRLSHRATDAQADPTQLHDRHLGGNAQRRKRLEAVGLLLRDIVSQDGKVEKVVLSGGEKNLSQDGTGGRMSQRTVFFVLGMESRDARECSGG